MFWIDKGGVFSHVTFVVIALLCININVWSNKGWDVCTRDDRGHYLTLYQNNVLD